MYLANRILDTKAEKQSFERVRRVLGMDVPVMCIEPGLAGRRVADYEKQLAASMVHESCPLIAASHADIRAQESDSFNRHLE